MPEKAAFSRVSQLVKNEFGGIQVWIVEQKYEMSFIVCFSIETYCCRPYIYVVNLINYQFIGKFIAWRKILDRLLCVLIPWDGYFNLAKCYDCRIHDSR